MTTVSEEKAGKEGSPAGVQEPESTADRRARAKSIALPSPAALEPVTVRARAAGQAVARTTGGAVTKTTEYLDRPGSLVHAQPPTFARAREKHHLAAGKHDTPLFRYLRLTWGYVHLLIIKTALNGLEWVTETPLRFAGALVLALIIYFWS